VLDDGRIFFRMHVSKMLNIYTFEAMKTSVFANGKPQIKSTGYGIHFSDEPFLVRWFNTIRRDS